jgi:hypothetical protein
MNCFSKLVDSDPALAALLADRELGITVPGKGGPSLPAIDS